MKKTTLAAILIALIFLLMTAMAEDWRADLTKLLNPEEIPATTTIRYDVHTPEGAQVQEKRHAVELVSSRGDVLNVEAVFNLVNLPLTDDQWQEVQSWFKSLVMDSVQAIGADSESLASVVAQAVVDARKAAQAQGSLAVWANNNLMIKTLSATVPYYPTLQKGDKGDEVKQLQQRLLTLNYLNGSADGDYGNKTKEAVEAFQVAANISVTGIADDATQKALFSESAPKAKVYKKLNFKELSRNPDQHKGEYYSFSGQVIQALESSNWDGTTSVTLRIATKSWYDDVVMVTYSRESDAPRILEDDKVTVKGEYKGIESYTAIMGNTVTIPLFDGEQVKLK